MSDSDWSREYTVGLIVVGLVVAALITVGIWGASGEQGQYAITAYEHSRDNQQQAQKEIEEGCRVLSSAEQARCIREAQRATYEAERDIADLKAQQTMSVWTRYMGIAAIVGVGLSLFGVALIFVTFRETQAAAQASRNAARIAGEVLQHEQNVSEVELRPYWSGDFERMDAVLSDPELAAFHVFIRFINRGKTPANSCIFAWEFSYHLDEEDHTLEMEEAPVGTIAPGADLQFDHILQLLAETWEAIKLARYSAWVQIDVSVKFFDYLGQQWVYQHGFRFGAANIADNTPIPTYESYQAKIE